MHYLKSTLNQARQKQSMLYILIYFFVFISPNFIFAQTLKLKIITTAEKGDIKFKDMGESIFVDHNQPTETEVCIFVDPSKKFQTLIGIGGALTDASAETFSKLKPAKQKEFMNAYYNQTEGIGYSLGRTNIHSCDFSSDMYTYVNENDKDLKSFNLQHDLKYKIPFIKQAILTSGGQFSMYASPWSPPAWMKDTKNMLQGGKLLPEFRQTWANYLVKFIKEYEKLGIPMWGLTVQNEPMAKQTWESCVFSAEEERDFVKLFLGPTLAKEGLASKKLITWDHNRDLVYQRASNMLDDPEAAKYVWGIGYHWYETWTGSEMLFDNLKRVKETYPDKELFFTEGCVEKFNFSNLKSWALGEKYGYSMINDFNAGTAGWTDWNVLLDETGGPNHVGNFCYAPIIADTRTGELIYTNIYYYIGHFSKYIKPGSKRLAVSTNRDQLLATAFVNPDGKIAIVVMNKSDKALKYNLWIKGKSAPVESLAHSISTLILN